jgi:hypothetical protein
MVALLSTKSARGQLEKLTGDFDRTDGSTDDGGAAEVAEGRVLMVDGGWCLAFVLSVVTKMEKGYEGSTPWLLLFSSAQCARP